MNDIQNQVESAIAEFDNGWIGPKRAKAVAAALAEAGLLADDMAVWGRRVMKERDAARAELAMRERGTRLLVQEHNAELAESEAELVEVKAELGRAHAATNHEHELRLSAEAELAEVKAKGLPQDELSAAYHELGTHGIKKLIADAERRGAVSALRAAADEYAKGQGYQRMVAANLRARADRIEGETRG